MSQLCDDEICFTWNIENYSFCVNEFYRSPVFKVENLDHSTWSIFLYPRGHSDSHKDFVSLKLALVTYEKILIGLEICFRIELCNAKEVFVSEERKGIVFRNYDEKLIKELIRIDEIENKIKNSLNNELIVRCWIGRQIRDSSRCLTTSFYGKTEISFDSYSFMWLEIYLFAFFSATKTFTIDEKLKLCLSTKAPQDDFLFEIQLVTQTIVRVKCEIIILDYKGEEKFSNWDFFTFDKNSSKVHFPVFLKKSLLKEIFGNRKIYLKFNFSISNKLSISKLNETTQSNLLHSPSIPKPGSTSNSLKEDLRLVLFSKELADVNFRVDSEIISAHKIILASRSPVFSAMFQQKMVENETGVIDISDTDVRTLKLFLEYLYTGETDPLDSERTLDLLLVAEKYQVPSLKEELSEFLKNALTTENVCDVISVADMVRHQTLKTAAIDYIKMNSKDILGSSKWLKWIKKNAELCSEIFYALSVEFQNIQKEK